MTSSNNSNHFTSSDSNFGFNPPPSSRPRFVKVKKQSASHHPRSSNSFTFGGSGTGTRVADLGSNPSQPSSYAATSTSTSILGNTNATNVGSSRTFLFGVDSSSKIEKSSFASGSSRSTAVNVGGKAENLISDELRKLKFGIGAGDASDQLQMGQPSNEMPFHNFSKTKHSDPQQAGAQDKNLSGLHIPPDFEYGETKLHDTTSSSMSASFSSNNYQPVWNDFYASSMNRPEKVEFPFTSRLDSMGTPHVEFKTPNMKGNFFSGDIEDIGRGSFAIAASSAQGQSSTETRHHKKKHRPKIGHDSFSPTPNTKISYASPSVEFFPLSGSSTFPSPRQGKKGDVSSSLSRNGDKSESVKEQGKEKIIPNSTGSTTAQEACEKWRLRGNQAYDTGDLSKAEDYYTQGLNSVSQSETSRSEDIPGETLSIISEQFKVSKTMDDSSRFDDIAKFVGLASASASVQQSSQPVVQTTVHTTLHTEALSSDKSAILTQIAIFQAQITSHKAEIEGRQTMIAGLEKSIADLQSTLYGSSQKGGEELSAGGANAGGRNER